MNAVHCFIQPTILGKWVPAEGVAMQDGADDDQNEHSSAPMETGTLT